MKPKLDLCEKCPDCKAKNSLHGPWCYVAFKETLPRVRLSEMRQIPMSCTMRLEYLMLKEKKA